MVTLAESLETTEHQRMTITMVITQLMSFMITPTPGNTQLKSYSSVSTMEKRV